MKERKKRFNWSALLVALTPFCFWVLIVIYTWAVIMNPGWGTNGGPWRQPDWLLKFGLTDSQVWQMPLIPTYACSTIGVIAIVIGGFRKNVALMFSGALCLISGPFLWGYFVIASF